MLNVLCMKWGTAYGADDVNILQRMVARNLKAEHRFVCYTDDASGLSEAVTHYPLPEIHVPAEHQKSPWRKISLFRPDLQGVSGRALFLDLDVVVTGALDEVAAYGAERKSNIAIAENWTQPGRGVGNSSVFTYEIGKHGYIFDAFAADPHAVIGKYLNSQTFMSLTAREAGNLIYFPKEWIRSFKVDCMPNGPAGVLNWLLTPKLPEDARVIAFHGRPKPSDAARGQYPGKPLKHVRKTPWIEKYWY